MHLFMIITAVAVAYRLRSSGNIPQGNWHLRWQKNPIFIPLSSFTDLHDSYRCSLHGYTGENGWNVYQSF